ncbi:MAG: glycosyltransferase, partial [Ramlibacter sp.]
MKLTEPTVTGAAPGAQPQPHPPPQPVQHLPSPPRPQLKRIALVSDHASPLAAPGSIDCGGQNVYVAHLARELALAGYLVDIFTRRDAIGQQQLVHLPDNTRVVHVPAGPAHHVPKEQMLPYMQAFARFVTRFARRQPALYDIVHANFFMSGMVAQHLKQV